MEVWTALRSRRMVRRYASRTVDPATVDAVLEAAGRAPSAGFTQGVSYLVLAGDDLIDYWTLTAPAGPADGWLAGMRTAPVLILVWTSQQRYLDRYARPDKGWAERDPERWSSPYWWVDAGMGVMAALLAAVDAGLGACFFGVPPARVPAVRERFGVPDSEWSVGAITLGFAAPDPTPRPRTRRAVAHHGRWGDQRH